MTAVEPFVSVVIPSFNRAQFLNECVLSVLNQTHRHLEVIVVDDGSRDQTATLMHELMAVDARVRYVYQANAGVSAARNHGLRLAEGEFIALLDSDDAWAPWKIERQLQAFSQLPEVGLIWSDMTAISPTGAVLHARFLKQMYGAYRRLPGPLFINWRSLPGEGSAPAMDLAHGMIYSQMMYGNLVHTSTVLMRRERMLATGPFAEGIRRGGEDYAYHLEACRQGPVAFLDYPTTLYRIGCDDQITHRRNQVTFAASFLATLRAQLAEHRAEIHLSPRELSRILSDAHAWLGSESRVLSWRLAAVQHLLSAIRHDPSNRYAWSELARTFTPKSLRRVMRRLLRHPATSPPVPA